MARGVYRKPFVLGAVIDLGNCLDLLVRENLDLLKVAYDSLVVGHQRSGQAMPQNRDLKTGGAGDKLLRFLDCAVIRRLHSITDAGDAGTAEPASRILPFDTVRGLFTEGEPAYPGAGFHVRTHTQIAVRNQSCIKGVFLPR